MRKMNWTIRLLLTLLIVVPMLMDSHRAEAWTGMPMSKLHVSGNQLVNSSGQPVLLSGWHQPSGSYWTYQSSRYYLDRNGGNRHAAILDYLKEITDTFTGTSAKYGSSHGWYMNQVATTPSNLNKFNEIWGYLASQPAIKSADNVMFELINEPVLSDVNGQWGGNPSQPNFADYWNSLKNFQNSLISTIRSKGADNVIWAAGLGWDQYYSSARPVR